VCGLVEHIFNLHHGCLPHFHGSVHGCGGRSHCYQDTFALNPDKMYNDVQSVNGGYYIQQCARAECERDGIIGASRAYGQGYGNNTG